MRDGVQQLADASHVGKRREVLDSLGPRGSNDDGGDLVDHRLRARRQGSWRLPGLGAQPTTLEEPHGEREGSFAHGLGLGEVVSRARAVAVFGRRRVAEASEVAFEQLLHARVRELQTAPHLSRQLAQHVAMEHVERELLRDTADSAQHALDVGRGQAHILARGRAEQDLCDLVPCRRRST